MDERAVHSCDERGGAPSAGRAILRRPLADRRNRRRENERAQADTISGGVAIRHRLRAAGDRSIFCGGRGERAADVWRGRRESDDGAFEKHHRPERQGSLSAVAPDAHRHGSWAGARARPSMYSLIRNLLFLLDAESAHDFTTAQMRRLQEIPLVLAMVERLCRAPRQPRRLWGLEFPTSVGIAAGFDKNALLMPFLAALGFGFLEVGTVTLHAQSGNPKPRLFRDPVRRALINRLGFNNDGADAVAERLQRCVRPVPVFVNIGKNRDVSLDDAPNAYAQCYLRVARWADGAVLNLSSPNTPGLRELQRPEHLVKVLDLVRAVREQMPFARPILVKIAPDLDRTQIGES